MAKQFYEIAAILDELKDVKNPTATDINLLTKTIVGSQYIRYFFHDLNNPDWVKPVHNLGWFYKVPPPLENKNQPGYYSMPLWYEGDYLSRMAKDFPEVVKDVALSLETDNSRAIRTILEALLKIPVNITVEIIGKFKQWIETPFANFMMLSHELGMIMEYLTKGEQIEAALSVLDILLEPIQVKDRFEEDKLIAGSRHDYHWLNELLTCPQYLYHLQS